MKQLCESMLIPSKTNYIDLLRASDLLSSKNLRFQVIRFLRDNFSALSEIDAEDEFGNSLSLITVLNDEFPGLLGEVLELRREAHPRPPSSLLIRRTTENQKEIEEIRDSPVFPYWALGVMFVCTFSYMFLSKLIVLGPVIPVINVGGLFLFIFYIFNKLKSDQ
jgi:hypothetical protein